MSEEQTLNLTAEDVLRIKDAVCQAAARTQVQPSLMQGDPSGEVKLAKRLAAALSFLNDQASSKRREP